MLILAPIVGPVGSKSQSLLLLSILEDSIEAQKSTAMLFTLLYRFCFFLCAVQTILLIILYSIENIFLFFLFAQRHTTNSHCYMKLKIISLLKYKRTAAPPPHLIILPAVSSSLHRSKIWGDCLWILLKWQT